MSPRAIPDRWLNYQPIGQRIMGTRFIAFKVPLREEIVESVEDNLRLSCDSLLKKVPNIGMIIDLTNTNRYYDPYFFIKQGIRYEKLMIPGHVVPPANLVQIFKMMVHDYLKENANNTKLIGVHCTHGVNRTGYLICNFMVSEMKIDPNEAIRSFEAARGHLIERQNYRNDLMGGISSKIETIRPNWRSRSSHQPKGFSINRNREETNRDRDWRRRDRPSSPRTFSMHREQEDGNNRDLQNRWRARDGRNGHQEHQSFNFPARPTTSTGDYGGNYQSRYKTTQPENRIRFVRDLS